MSIMNNSQ